MKYNDIKDLSYTELKPEYTRANSFYKKAKVYSVDEYLYLVSYETIVARYNTTTEKFEIFPDKSYQHRLYRNGTHSMTTIKHIDEFMKQLNVRENYMDCIVRD